uniref:Uncharacterized protein n=1 Tax=Cacopsylla melanoneura TaxID=428564 RepID=A0A8D8Y4J1_9HEMI
MIPSTPSFKSLCKEKLMEEEDPVEEEYPGFTTSGNGPGRRRLNSSALLLTKSNLPGWSPTSEPDSALQEEEYFFQQKINLPHFPLDQKLAKPIHTLAFRFGLENLWSP